MRRRNLGFSDISVSEVALGTQRWGGTDFNSPDEATCHQMLDIATAAGVNFVDTAEQYPIPGGRNNPEGYTERIIGSWLAKDPARRERLVIASKITGGGNVTPKNIEADLQGTLKRLGTDYLDVYLLHWPARYTPQANWGQSLEYNWLNGQYSRGGASFEQIAATMGKLVEQGKIRGWGSTHQLHSNSPVAAEAASSRARRRNIRLESMPSTHVCIPPVAVCNDNTYGLMGSTMAAKQLGVTPPCVMQNDYSLLNRRIEENGLSEASAPWNENVGFLGYNTLAGGVLTGKCERRRVLNSVPPCPSCGTVPNAHIARRPMPSPSTDLETPASTDDSNPITKLQNSMRPRGRMDEAGWGRTLYRYRSGPATEATRAYAAIAKEAGMSLTELSLRWCRSRRACTSVLLGQSSVAQLEEGLQYFSDEPCAQDEAGDFQEYLPGEVLWEIDRVHMRNRLPIFASTRVAKNWNGEGEIGENIP